MQVFPVEYWDLNSKPLQHCLLICFVFDAQDEGITLELSKTMSYDKVEAAVAKALRERGHTVPQDNFLRFTAQQVFQPVSTTSYVGRPLI